MPMMRANKARGMRIALRRTFTRPILVSPSSLRCAGAEKWEDWLGVVCYLTTIIECGIILVPCVTAREPITKLDLL